MRTKLLRNSFALIFLFYSATALAQANKTLSNLTTPTAVNRSLVPGKDNKSDLGTKSFTWRNLYFSGGLYVGTYRAISFDINNINQYFGPFAGANHTTGVYNIANGYSALQMNTTGSYNIATGYESLFTNTAGSNNIATGYRALYYNTADDNTATGYQALTSNTSGFNNTATGSIALENNTTGNNNTATGVLALLSNKAGSSNTADGVGALQNNTSGSENTAVGEYALQGNGTGNDLTAVGYAADVDFTSGTFSNGSAFGYGALITASNQVRIGDGDVTSIGGYTNWSNISDGRVKKNIQPNVPGLAFINKLTPITYNLDLNAADKILQRPLIKDKDGKTINLSERNVEARKNKEQVLYSGFIAQDVEKAARSLNYDFSGVDAAKSAKDLYGLRYAEFVVPLVKAVQELSKSNDEKDARINDLQEQINELRAMFIAARPAVNNQQSATVSSASLQQNVPNPFNHATSINYTVPHTSASAKIIIVNKAGNILKEINISGTGKGSVAVDAATLSAGAYSYSLYVDGKMISTKQMIIVK